MAVPDIMPDPTLKMDDERARFSLLAIEHFVGLLRITREVVFQWD